MRSEPVPVAPPNFRRTHKPSWFSGARIQVVLFWLAFSYSLGNINAATTALVVSGGPEEPITNGGSYTYLPANGTFTFYEQGSGIHFRFQGATVFEDWFVDLSAPYPSQLAVGNYDLTTGAGISVGGFAIGCQAKSYSFVVHELVRELDGVIVSFHASFRYSCGETDASALVGDIFYNSSDPLPPPTRITNSKFSAFITKGQLFRFQVTSSAHLPAYSATGLPPGLTVNFGTGLISGTPTAEGFFPAMIAVQDVTNNTSASATLELTVDPASHSRGPHSALSLLGDPGNHITNGLDVFVGPNDAVIHGDTNPPDYTFANVNGGGWGVSLFTGGIRPLESGGIYHRADPPGPNEPNVAAGGPNGGNLSGSTGNFEVLNFDHDENGLKDFRATFEYHYGNELPALRGRLWYRVTNAITSRTPVRVLANTAFSYQIIANNAPTAFSAENLPAGTALDPVTGIISGTITTPGRYFVTVSAINGSQIATDEICIYILPPAPAKPGPTPVVSISVNTNQIKEGGVARFTATSSAPSTFNLTPRFQITRKKASANDFTVSPSSFVIPAGQTAASIDLHAVVDAAKEKSETVTIKLVKGPGYKVPPNSKASVTIIDGP
jgi:hypothetical protein